MSKAVSCLPYDSATIRVDPSGVTAMPLGNARSIGDLSGGAIGSDHRDDAGARLRSAHHVEADAVDERVAPVIDDHLVPRIGRDVVELRLGARGRRPGRDAAVAGRRTTSRPSPPTGGSRSRTGTTRSRRSPRGFRRARSPGPRAPPSPTATAGRRASAPTPPSRSHPPTPSVHPCRSSAVPPDRRPTELDGHRIGNSSNGRPGRDRGARSGRIGPHDGLVAIRSRRHCRSRAGT